MTTEQIPDRVSRLIADCIDSVPELEAVLLLRRGKDRLWTASDAAKLLYVSVPVASYVLDLLTGRGFFAHLTEGYRYQPATPELDSTVGELATTYAQHLVTITNLIHSKPTAKSVEQLAEAFRLREVRRVQKEK